MAAARRVGATRRGHRHRHRDTVRRPARIARPVGGPRCLCRRRARSRGGRRVRPPLAVGRPLRPAVERAGDADVATLLALMEAQRWRLAMFSSDGWYWDDPMRPETAAVLRAAARAARIVDGLADAGLERAAGGRPRAVQLAGPSDRRRDDLRSCAGRGRSAGRRGPGLTPRRQEMPTGYTGRRGSCESIRLSTPKRSASAAKTARTAIRPRMTIAPIGHLPCLLSLAWPRSGRRLDEQAIWTIETPGA